MQEGALNIFNNILRQRFGEVPAWAEQQLSAKSTAELIDLSGRLLTAGSIKELLQ